MEPDDDPGRITQLLGNWGKGDLGAREELIPLVYQELRLLASSYLRHERPEHTLRPTALVHEAYLRLVDQSANWENRRHFFGAAAQAMRRILVDHARGHRAEKRGSGFIKVPLTEAAVMSHEQPAQMLALNESLTRVEEITVILGISPSTVKRDWALAKAWLMREIGTREPS